MKRSFTFEGYAYTCMWVLFTQSVPGTMSVESEHSNQIWGTTIQDG